MPDGKSNPSGESANLLKARRAAVDRWRLAGLEVARVSPGQGHAAAAGVA